jgi:hypothetical protein
MTVQKNGPVVSAVIVAVGSLVGAGLTSVFLPTVVDGHGHFVEHAVWTWVLCSIGAVLGGLFFSWAGKR